MLVKSKKWVLLDSSEKALDTLMRTACFSSSSVQFRPVFSSFIHFRPVLSGSVQFCPVPSSFLQFSPFLSSFVQFRPVSSRITFNQIEVRQIQGCCGLRKYNTIRCTDVELLKGEFFQMTLQDFIRAERHSGNALIDLKFSISVHIQQLF